MSSRYTITVPVVGSGIHREYWKTYQPMNPYILDRIPIAQEYEIANYQAPYNTSTITPDLNFQSNCIFPA